MRPMIPILVAATIAFALPACGDNLEPEPVDTAGVQRIVCGDGPECDDQLAASLARWQSDDASIYTYATRFSSSTGLEIETEIDVAGGAPVARRASGVRPDDGTGLLEPFAWSEDTASLGLHSEGARPVPIATLYEECVLEIFAVDRGENEVVLELFASGELKACTYRPKGCVGDCTFGPRLESIELAAR